jgi:hypothetical protein
MISRKNWRIVLSIVFTVFLILGTLSAAFAADYAIDEEGETVTIGTSKFIGYYPSETTGTGVVNPYLRISANSEIVQGYNTDFRPLQYNEDSSWTDSIKLSDIPTILKDGILYREFQLDINQNSGGDSKYLSLDEVQIWVGGANVSTITGFTPPTTPTGWGTFPASYSLLPVFNMDATEDNSIKLDYSQNPGSGKRDLKLLVPNELFGSYGSECAYLDPNCNSYVVFYTLFGEKQTNNDGFEEWGVAIYNVASGYKWNDLNANGVWEENEPALEGWTICAQEMDKKGNPIGEPICSITDENGRYIIPLVSGTYRITETLQSDWFQSYPSIGYHQLTLSGGQRVDNLNFGNYSRGCLKIVKTWDDLGTGAVYEGTVYVDIFDTDEEGAEPIDTLELVNVDGVWEADKCGLLPGDYWFGEVSVPGWTPDYTPSTMMLTVVAGEDPAESAIGSIENTIDLGCLEVQKFFTDYPLAIELPDVIVDVYGPDGNTFVDTLYLNEGNDWTDEICDLLPGEYYAVERTIEGWTEISNTGPVDVVAKDTAKIEITNKYNVCWGDETAWAYSDIEHAIPINSLVKKANWGWTNGPLAQGRYEWDIYAGAAQNDISKGMLVGKLIVNYTGECVTVEYDLDEGYYLGEIHLYVGNDKLPSKLVGKKSVLTADPGQFPISEYIGFVPGDTMETSWISQCIPVSGEIYVAAHAVVWMEVECPPPPVAPY